MQRHGSMALLGLVLVTSGACAKDGAPTSGAAPGASGAAPPAAAGGAVDPAALTSRIGVQPGGWTYDAEQGGAAVVMTQEGPVEVRRVGEEQFQPVKAETALYPGDLLRTQAQGRAVVVLADESTVELAEHSAVSVGDRQAMAEPSSTVAVMAGVVRFSVSPRGKGEGPFLVHTPAGVAVARGTVYAVGVAASGHVRVGVETGTVEVAGIAKLDAPVSVPAGQAVVLEPAGTLAAPVAFASDDWGEWRDQSEAGLEPGAAAKLHADALIAVEGTLPVAYTDLDSAGAAVAEGEVRAEASMTAADATAYAGVAGDISVALDGAFWTAVRLELLSAALVAHAYTLAELSVRHPEPVAPVLTVAAPHMHAAILWNKKYFEVVPARIEPLRVSFYHHHPRGRLQAAAVGHTIPAFYAKVDVKAAVKSRPAFKLQGPVYAPPVVAVSAPTKRVHWGIPAASWHAKVQARPAAYRGKAWYTAPAMPKAKLVAGVAVRGSYPTAFAIPAPSVKARVRAAVNAQVAVPEVPDVELPNASAKLRGNVKAKIPTADVRGQVSAAKAVVKPPKVDVKGKLEGKLGGLAGAGGPAMVDLPKGGAGAAIKAGAGGAGQAGAGASVKASAAVKVKVPAPPPPPPPPKVEVKAKAKLQVGGGFKIGN